MVLVNLGLVRGPNAQFLWFRGRGSQWVDCGLRRVVLEGEVWCRVGFGVASIFV